MMREAPIEEGQRRVPSRGSVRSEWALSYEGDSTMPKKRSSWGSIRSRSKDVHEIRYTVGGVPQSETYHGTRKGADRRKAELRLKYEGKGGSMLTVSEFYHEVFHPECEARIENEGMTKDGMSIVTLDGYDSVFKASIEGTEVDIPMEDLTGKIVQGWLSKMTAGKARHAKQLLGTIIGRANDLEYMDKNVMLKRYIMPSRTSGKGRTKDVYSLDELEAILQAVEGQWWEAAYIMASFGGGQLAEVTGVKPHEIEAHEREDGIYAVAWVNRGVHRLKGRVEVTERAKNEHRTELPMIIRPPYSVRLLGLRDAAIERGDAWMHDDGFGNVADPSAIQRAYKSFLARSTFRYIPFGNLRNAYSTSLHSMEIPSDTVHKLMRHSTNTTDYEHYNRISVEELEGIIGNHL